MVAYIITSCLLLTLFYVFFILFMRKTTFFRFNRMALMLGTAVCMLLPLVNFNPRIFIGADELPFLVIPEFSINLDAAGVTGHPFSWTRLIAGIYLAGAAAVLAISLISLARTEAIIRHGKVEQFPEGRVSLVENGIPSFSFLRTIVISREDYVNNPAILQHEKAHVKFHHSTDLLLFSAVTVLHWFNPLVWMARAELKMLHEYEADEAVIKQGIDATQYQLLLVKRAVGAQRFHLANGFNHTKLKKRITMMQTTESNKLARLGYVFCIPVLFAALCLCTNQAAVTDGDGEESQVSATKGAETSDIQKVPFDILDEKPLFNGQEAQQFIKWVTDRIEYPESAKSAGIEGRVMISFTISSEGKVSDVKVIGSADSALDAEAVRVVAQSPDWTPAKKEGQAVPVSMAFPVIFHLQ